MKCASCQSKKPVSYYIKNNRYDENNLYRSCEECRQRSRDTHRQKQMAKQHGGRVALYNRIPMNRPTREIPQGKVARCPEGYEKYGYTCYNNEDRSIANIEYVDDDSEAQSDLDESDDENPELTLMKDILGRYMYYTRYPNYIVEGDYFDENTDEFIISRKEINYYMKNKMKYGDELYKDYAEAHGLVSKGDGRGFKFKK